MSEDREYLPAIESHLVQSKYVDQIFKIQVMQPARMRSEKKSFPVVFATDGNFSFETLKGISCGLQTGAQAVPRFILVGIGYPSDDPKAGILLRCRDFTFPGYPRLKIGPPAIEGVLVPREGGKSFDGAEDFQRFIGEELIPLVQGNYDCLHGDRTYFGHSAGAGFGLYSLFTRPELFKNYIISSAATFFNGTAFAGMRYDSYDFIMPLAQAYVAAGGSSSERALYMSVGSEEEFEPELREWQLTSSCYRLAAYLRSASIPGLNVTAELFSGERHMTSWPMAFMHGVQAVFGRPSRE